MTTNLTSRPEGLRRLATTTADVANVSASVLDNTTGLTNGELIVRGLRAGPGVSINVVDADGFGSTLSKVIEIATVGGTGTGEANTISSVGGGITLTATTPKIGADLRTRSLAAGQNISISVSGDLITVSSSVPAGPAGEPGLVWKGTWNSSTTYAMKDVVSYNGSSYVCKVSTSTNSQPPSSHWDLLAQKGDAGATGAAGPTGATGATGPQGIQGVAGPKGLTWKGAWNSSDTYNIDDAVHRNGSAWVAIASNSNADPSTSASNWSLLAQKGDVGATGPAGPTGSTGQPGLVWKGTWAADTVYSVNDAVTYNGSSYRVVTAHTSDSVNIPPNSNLELLASKGDAGATGAAGPTGPSGLVTVNSVGDGAGDVFHAYDSGTSTLTLRKIKGVGAVVLGVDANNNVTIEAQGLGKDTDGNITITPDVNKKTIIGGVEYTGRLTATITASMTNQVFFTFIANGHEATFVDYILNRGTGNVRIGTLMVLRQGSTVEVSDQHGELGTTGVTFSAVINGSNVDVRYTSTAGVDGTIAYNARHWAA